jgi:hypothetical protein
MPSPTTSGQWAYNRPHYVEAAVATDGTNATLVTLTVHNAQGALSGPKIFDVYLSDSTAGVGLTATTASGAVGDKTAGTTGTVIATLTTKKALRVQSLAAGTYQLSITDTAKTAFKICVNLDGVIQVVATLATASYG